MFFKVPPEKDEHPIDEIRLKRPVISEDAPVVLRPAGRWKKTCRVSFNPCKE